LKLTGAQFSWCCACENSHSSSDVKTLAPPAD
jgi:hypothetical protein